MKLSFFSQIGRHYPGSELSGVPVRGVHPCAVPVLMLSKQVLGKHISVLSRRPADRGIFSEKCRPYIRPCLPRFLTWDLSRRRGCGGLHVPAGFTPFSKKCSARARGAVPRSLPSELSSVVTWGHVSGSQTAPTARRASYPLGVPSALVRPCGACEGMPPASACRARPVLDTGAQRLVCV